MTEPAGPRGPAVPPSPPFLAGGGEMGARMRAHPWESSPLGPPEHWPAGLRSVTGLILVARQPMFAVWGPELVMLYNDAYAGLLGDKHPDALGARFAAAWSDIWPQFGPLVARVLAGEALSFEDLPIAMRRHGYDEETWFSFSYTPLRDDAGAVRGLFCACMETTGKVLGERALRRSEALLEARVAERTAELDRVWRNSRDLLVVIGADGVFRAVSPAWTDILGHAPAEVVGRRFTDFIWPEDRDRTQGGLDRAVARHDLTGFENRYTHRDGTPRWISWHSSADGDLVYGYGRHVTAEKEQAAALARIEAQLRQAQKMEAVGQLSGGLAHDFNNMLAGISGGLELIRRRLAQGRAAGLDRYITAAQDSALRAASLTHRLLAFSRQQTLEPRAVAVNRLVDGMLELVRRTMGPEIRVCTRLADAAWPILCDANQLENALLNLCINARDAMPDGGRLRIETANLVLDEAAAHAREMAPGAYVGIAVVDTGTGMTAEVQARAFDPFFTTKPIGAGSGLGLSMIYGFARQSGGQVQIVSAPGSGTTMLLHLPRHLGAAAEAVAAPAAPDAAAPAGGSILVVDDEETIRMLVAEALGDLGYAVQGAGDGAGALAVLRSGARVDLLVTDIGMPGGMNGRQLAEAALALRPGLPVLFITGYAEQELLAGGPEGGVQVLAKPFAMDALAGRVAALLAER